MNPMISAAFKMNFAGALAALMIGASAFVLATFATVESAGASSHFNEWRPVPAGTGPTVWVNRPVEGSDDMFVREPYAWSVDAGGWLPVLRDGNGVRRIDPNRKILPRHTGGLNFGVMTDPWRWDRYPIGRGKGNRGEGGGGQNDGGGQNN